MRQTAQRQAIYEALHDDTSHPTADTVYQRVRQKIKNISLGTVYRNLNRLVSEGAIQEIPVADGPSRYDYRTDKHYHFICDGCGSVCDVNLPFQANLNKQLEASSKLSIRTHQIVFYGLCSACKGKARD